MVEELELHTILNNGLIWMIRNKFMKRQRREILDPILSISQTKKIYTDHVSFENL